MGIYQAIRTILLSRLKIEPEWMHRQTLGCLSWLARLSKDPQRSPLTPLPVRGGPSIEAQLQQSLALQDPRLEQTLWGLTFSNPVGLAAGFDKDGVAVGIWDALGFGFAEIGTVTLHAQPGNPRPRLFSLDADRAALNRMGFNNNGAAAMAARFAQHQMHPTIPIGINLGKSKVTPLESAATDYLGSFRQLEPWGDYFVVNVSSPNTPGLRTLQDATQLSLILEALAEENKKHKPILVKISPDLDWGAIAEVVALATTYRLAGIIATNTTISRDGLKTQVLPRTGKAIASEAGGISGAPLRARSTEVIRFIWQQTQGQLPIIGVGGIFTASDAWEKITAGASLVQVYTGFVYEGPLMVRRILTGLLQKLEERGLTSISEAVGIG